MGHFSGSPEPGAGRASSIPVVVRTTEDMLRLMPQGMRDASVALGAPHGGSSSLIYPRRAAAASLTGMLLAVARISGETAPLLFTGLNNQFWSTNLECAHGQPAGGDLPVRAEPVRRLAAASPGSARC